MAVEDVRFKESLDALMEKIAQGGRIAIIFPNRRVVDFLLNAIAEICCTAGLMPTKLVHNREARPPVLIWKNTGASATFIRAEDYESLRSGEWSLVWIFIPDAIRASDMEHLCHRAVAQTRLGKDPRVITSNDGRHDQ